MKDRIIFGILTFTGVLFIITGAFFAKYNFIYAIENRLDYNHELLKKHITGQIKVLSSGKIEDMDMQDLSDYFLIHADIASRKDVEDKIIKYNNEIKSLNSILEKFPNNIISDIMGISKRKIIEIRDGNRDG